MNVHGKHIGYFCFSLILLSAISCTSVKKAVYFKGQKDSTIISSNLAPDVHIRGNDILSILFSSSNAEASAAFNSVNSINVTSTSSSGSLNQSTGYLVNKEGFISLPLIGKMRVEGLTTEGLQDLITKIITEKKLLVDPLVSIRILNFKVTVLGEVEKPGVLNVPSEKISLLEALGLAGDLTINAQRDNVLLIREEAGEKILRRINLNSSELFTSPYYYLNSNDVIYVEPNKVKVRNNGNASLWVSIILSTLSFGIILVDHIK